MKLESTIIKEIRGYPTEMSWELVDRWGDGIPILSENNPDDPEWRATSVKHLDLSKEGYGEILVKNEADKTSNPTGTIKDRAAWEITTLYRDLAIAMYLKKTEGTLDGNISSKPVPTFSLITAGNAGLAVANMFKKYNLPPIKLLVDSIRTSKERLETLKKLHADVYMVDLSKKELSPEDIKLLTNNKNGIEITSLMGIEPHAIFYDWHVHEAFNENPDEIYVPYGSGRLMENYLTWQQRTFRKAVGNVRDPRLNVRVGKVISIDILGATPEELKSDADKLVTDYNPFRMFDDSDVSSLISLEWTGRNTDVYTVSEEKLNQAVKLLADHGIEAEKSGAAGLALYLQRFEEGKVDPRKKVLIINTGNGI
jgi:threonine synthase